MDSVPKGSYEEQVGIESYKAILFLFSRSTDTAPSS